MTQPPQQTERFAQHSRLSELVTALGFRRYPLFLTGRSSAPGDRRGQPRRRPGGLRRRRGVRARRARPDLAAVRRRPHTAVPEDLGGRPGRPQPGVLRPRGGQLDRGRRSINEVGIELLHHWLPPERPPLAITHSEVLGVVPLEVTDALLDELRRLADRHERGVLVEHVMELPAVS
jgi:hypothetical protein